MLQFFLRLFLILKIKKLLNKEEARDGEKDKAAEAGVP